MRKLLLIVLLSLPLSAQQSYSLLDIIPTNSVPPAAGRLSLVAPDGDLVNDKAVVFLAPDAMPSGEYALKWPQVIGTAGQFLRLASVVDGVGVLDFATGSGGSGTPAGADNEIQYNLTGAFAASASLKFFPDVSGASHLQLEDTDGPARIFIRTPATQPGLIRIERTSDSAGWAIYRPASSLDLRFFALGGAGDSFWMNSTGLGIGVSPTRKLDVNGDSNFRGGLFPQVDSLYDIGTGTTGNRFRWGFADIWNAEEFQIENTAHNAHFRLKYSTASPCNVNNCVQIIDPLGIVLMSWSTNNVNTSHRPFIPDADNARALGTSNFQWSEVRGRRHVAGSPSSAGAYNGQIDVFNAANNLNATLLGAALDGAGAAVLSQGSLQITTNGNFYNRTFSGGDASCGSITNGWTGIRTDTNEIQVCIGGALKKVALL